MREYKIGEKVLFSGHDAEIQGIQTVYDSQGECKINAYHVCMKSGDKWLNFQDVPSAMLKPAKSIWNLGDFYFHVTLDSLMYDLPAGSVIRFGSTSKVFMAVSWGNSRQFIDAAGDCNSPETIRGLSSSLPLMVVYLPE